MSVSWLAGELHLWRLNTLGRNPLIRSVDRVEAALIVAIVLVGILLLPLSFLAADVAYSAGVASAAVQRADRHTVVATVRKAQASQAQSVTATWLLPDHTTAVGVIPSATSDVVGATRTIWIDSHGQATDRPRPARAAVVQAVLAGLGTAAIVLIAMVMVVRMVTCIVDRSRLREWGNEWELSRLDARN